MDIQDDKPLFRKGNRYGYVYHTIFDHPQRGLLHYIGQKLGSELSIKYCGSGLLLGKFMKKYGRTGRVYRRLICFRASRNTLNAAEIRFIKEAKLLYGPSCLNLSYGGEDGAVSPETLAKRSKSLRGQKRSEETCARISAAKTGYVYSKEARAGMSAAAKGRKHTDETKAKIVAARLGKTLSLEARAKVSAARKGKPLSAETRAKLSVAHLGKTMAEETKLKLSQRFLGKPLSEESKAKKRDTIANQPKIKCPHCGTKASKGPIKRYHLDNCSRL